MICGQNARRLRNIAYTTHIINLIIYDIFFPLFSISSLSNSASFSELQYLASRHAAAIAAVAAAAIPPPPSSSTTPTGATGLGGGGTASSTSAVGSGATPVAAPPPPPPHQHDFHPAYRIPGYMEHLYSLQHAAATGSPGASSLHGEFLSQFYILTKRIEQNSSNPHINVSDQNRCHCFSLLFSVHQFFFSQSQTCG